MDLTQTNSGIDKFLLLIQRRAWLVGTVIACVLTTLLAFIHALPNLYQSKATIAVEARQVSRDVVPSNAIWGAEGRVRVLGQKILSRTRLSQLAIQFSLYPELARQPEAKFDLVDAMRGNIGLQVHGDGSDADPNITFDVSFLGTNPEKVQQVADALALFFIDENVKEKKNQTTGTAEFLRGQLKETQAKLEVQERALAEYKQRNIEELPEHLASNLGQLDQLRGELSAGTTALASAQQRLEVVSQRLALVNSRSNGSSEEVAVSNGQAVGENQNDPLRDPSIAMAVSAHTQLATLKTRLEGMKVNLSDKHPDVIQLRREIASLEEKIKTLPPMPFVPLNALDDKHSAASMSTPQVINVAAESARRASELVSLQTERTTLETEIGRRTLEVSRLKKEIAAFQERVERTPQRDQELQKLTRDYTTTHEFYLSLLKRLDDVMLAGNLEESPQAEKFHMLEPARVPEDPIGPRRKLLSIAALIVSLGVAFVVVLLREATTPVFHTIEELRAFTTVEILGSVPQIATQKEWKRQRVRHGLRLVSLGIVLFTLATVAQNVAAGNMKVARALSRSSGGMQTR
jgi:polysaccharide chain length determinant protein (PEP-CTERM system associated)